MMFDYAGGNWIKRIYYPLTDTGVVFNYSSFGVATSVSFRRQMNDPWGNISDGVETATVSFNYQQSTTPGVAPFFTQRTETAVNGPPATYSYSSSVSPTDNSMQFV